MRILSDAVAMFRRSSSRRRRCHSKHHLMTGGRRPCLWFLSWVSEVSLSGLCPSCGVASWLIRLRRARSWAAPPSPRRREALCRSRDWHCAWPSSAPLSPTGRRSRYLCVGRTCYRREWAESARTHCGVVRAEPRSAHPAKSGARELPLGALSQP